ncbi:MAG: substrate-binding domain-containing protein [Motiliproteus sp.]|nr:substrate-binding domain-containing protein [Motiliproteus sp.]
MPRLLPSLICLSLLLFSHLAQARDYWLISEFLNLNPQQRSISANFQDMVQALPRPADRRITKPVKISIIYPQQEQSDYWRRSVRSFESRLQELGIPYQINKFYTDPTADIRRQEQLVLTAVEDNTDYLIFTLFSNRHQRLLERIIANGKPKVILQNITTPIKAWHDKQPFLYVGFDHHNGTRLLANLFLKQDIAVKDYALVYWAKGYISELRGDSFIEIMRDNRKFQLSSSYYTNANRGSAYTAAANIMLENPNLGFIYTCSTDVAFGVSDVIKEKGKTGEILVNGWGGGSAELNALQTGELDVTVMRMNDDNGVAMAEAIKLDQEGKSQLVPTIYSGQFALVTKDTSAQEINRLKNRAFRYSGISVEPALKEQEH